MSNNSFALALTEFEQKAMDDIRLGAAAREALRFTQELDSDSFQQFILQLAHIAGTVYEWKTPARKAQEDDKSYNVRIEADFMQLTGFTLANLITNSKGWIGVWAGMVLDRGLMLIPEFNADTDAKDLAVLLDNWFEHCDLKRHLTPDAYSRLRGYLLEVHPHLKLFSKNIDKIVKPMLLDDDAGFGVAAKIRMAVDAVREAHKLNRGSSAIPRELGQVLATSFEKGGKHPDELRAEIGKLGFLPKWEARKQKPVQVGSWLLGSEETGDKRIEYLIIADSPEAITFLESMLGREPFVLRSDLGGDSDRKRREYKLQLGHDQSRES